jgi:anthranilate 1,2-dioxygenase small subunit
MSLTPDRLYRLLGEAQAAYARCIDDDALEAWPDFFTEKCRYIVTTAENYRDGLPAGLIYADSRGMLTDRVSALREANIYEQQSYRHILATPFIRECRDGEVTAETGFIVARIMRTGETSLFATGRYMDRYRVDDERLLISERVVVCDSAQIDTLLALPL